MLPDPHDVKASKALIEFATRIQQLEAELACLRAALEAPGLPLGQAGLGDEILAKFYAKTTHLDAMQTHLLNSIRGVSKEDVVPAPRANENGTSANSDPVERDLVLSSLEASLTKQVLWLVHGLRSFAFAAESIRMEIPPDAYFCKLITGALVSLSYQLADALLKDADRRFFFDDGLSYLKDLRLGLQEFCREISLDGRRYLAIALVDSGPNDVDSRRDAGKDCLNVHTA